MFKSYDLFQHFMSFSGEIRIEQHFMSSSGEIKFFFGALDPIHVSH